MYWIGNVDIHNNVDVRDIVGAKNFRPYHTRLAPTTNITVCTIMWSKHNR